MNLAEMNIRKISEYFRAGCKERTNCKIGVEIEHFVLDENNKNAGYAQIARMLREAYYHADVYYENNVFLGCETAEYLISLEPAAQLEISIKPRKKVLELEKVYQEFLYTLKPFLEKYQLHLETYGYQPYAKAADLPLIPKKRYEYMDAYLKRKGTQGIRMMRGSASTQVSIDYTSERDFVRKYQLAQTLSPIFALLTENTPVLAEKRGTPYLLRTEVWNHVDRRRCGIVPGSMREDFDFYRYAEYVYHVPLILVKENERAVAVGEWSAAEYYRERVMTEKEIEHMLSMVFPDVRLKNYIEIRMGDSLPGNKAFAYARLVRDIFYGESFAKVREYFGTPSETEIEEAKEEAMQKGTQAVLYGKPVTEIFMFLQKISEEPMHILLEEKKAVR